MPKDKSAPFNEAMHADVVRWLDANQDINLPAAVKQDLRRFNTLSDAEKDQLQDVLLALPQLPQVIHKFMPNRLEALPNVLLELEVGSYLNPREELKEMVKLSKRPYSLFQPRLMPATLLQYIAYGQQDKAEHVLAGVFQGQEEKIQTALRYKGKFSDYSGRTFNCSAYEYAYWAKDTHMRRMLEKHMNPATKAEMLRRCEAIEAEGLTYTQHGQAIVGSKHFDFTPLKTALQAYIKGYDAWEKAKNLDAMKEAWMVVGKAQRDVPAHVAQEYCRRDRSFAPLPQFDEATLPRTLAFYNDKTERVESWFPLAISDSAGIGVDFALSGNQAGDAWGEGGAGPGHARFVILDFAAVSRLDEVRTADLTLTCENLRLVEGHGLGMSC